MRRNRHIIIPRMQDNGFVRNLVPKFASYVSQASQRFILRLFVQEASSDILLDQIISMSSVREELSLLLPS